MKMMKNYMRRLATLVAVLIVSTSCLEKYPASAIPEDEGLRTFDDAEQFVTGIYARMMSGALWSGYLTLLPDIQADLVYAIDGYSNSYGTIWQWDIRPTNAEIESVYGSLYAVISNCNFYLENVDKVAETITDDRYLDMLEFYTGEVYVIRAFCYSELLKNFCKAYDPATAQNELGVVIRTKYSESEPSRRASLYDSYQFVLSDLAEAERRLDPENDAFTSYYMTHAAALALHARIALYMQDWQTAIDCSSRLIDHPNDAFRLCRAGSSNAYEFDYMWNYDVGVEVIWCQGFTTTSYGGALGSAFLGFTNDYTYFYPDYVPAEWVLNTLYSASDLRYNAYFANQQTGYDHGLNWPLLMKYYGNRTFLQNYIYHVSMPKPLRLAEQYLIRAEAYCRQATPDFRAASADLTTLRESRMTSGATVTLTADNYLDQIADERVRELYMEGFRLNDLKRWGKLYRNGQGFERKPQSNSLDEGSSLKVTLDNPLFVWPIPQHELEAPGSEVEPNESNK